MKTNLLGESVPFKDRLELLHSFGRLRGQAASSNGSDTRGGRRTSNDTEGEHCQVMYIVKVVL